MANKPLNISESAAVQMPMKTVASLILLVAAGVFAYTELTARLVSLETSRELFENDLLKKSEQVPVDQEQHFLLEDLYKSVEKMEKTQEMNMTNKVNIEFLSEQLDKALKDIEELKDKVREKTQKFSMSMCLKGKRVAMRGETGKNIQHQCIKSMAEVEENIDGSLSIKKLILE